MNINGKPTRTIWPVDNRSAVAIIDQTALPHLYRTLTLRNVADVARAIRDMQVRGAPLIGVAAAYGVALAMSANPGDTSLHQAVSTLAATRPTAVNLHWALQRMRAHLAALPNAERVSSAWAEAGCIAEEDVACNRAIGEHGLALLKPLAHGKPRLNVMTHCNAGWLATVDRGTALAPVYAACEAGLDVHVWVSETRPRNQGLLTAWELRQHGVPHTVIADNAAGWLMLRGEVDAVIVGADRVAANGDVANKVGTLLKALAAQTAALPFFVAAPSSTIDFTCPTGTDIPIESRDGEELRQVAGLDSGGAMAQLRQLPAGTPVTNPAFDVTPAALVSALICERGACAASAAGIATLFPESRHA